MATEFCRTAIQESHDADDATGEAHARRALGTALLYLGRYDDARESLNAALAIYDRIGDRLGQGNAQEGLGQLALLIGESDVAKAHLELALDRFRMVSDRRSEGHVLCYLGDLALRAGNLEEAQALAQLAELCLANIRDVQSQALLAKLLGGVALVRNDYVAAQRHLHRAAELHETSNDVGAAVCAQSLWAVSLAKLGRSGDAVAALERAQDQVARVPSPTQQAVCHFCQAWVLQRLGFMEASLGELGRGNEVLRRAGLREQQGYAELLDELATKEGRTGIELRSEIEDGAAEAWKQAMMALGAPGGGDSCAGGQDGGGRSAQCQEKPHPRAKGRPKKSRGKRKRRR